MAKRLVLLFIIILVFVIGGWGIWEARRFVSYPTFFAFFGIENWQVWEFHDYFALDPQDITVIWNDRRLADLGRGADSIERPLERNNTAWFSYNFVREFIDPFIFWDESVRTLFHSDLKEVSPVDDAAFFSGTGDMPWVPLEFLKERYQADISVYWVQSTVIFSTPENYGSGASVTARTANMRYRPDSTAFIAQRLERGTNLRVFNEEGDYIRVRTDEGLLGYVLISDIEYTGIMQFPVPDISNNFPDTHTVPLPISLTWEMITAPVGNATAMQNPLPQGLTVISPTWFNFDVYAPDGTLISYASREYVEWAHSHNVAVWAKVFDTNHDISHEILTNYHARQHVITQLINFVEEYRLDGININFEHIRPAVGRYYVQFLRELAPEMRRVGAVLSVATFVPAPWFAHYHHDLIGQTVDFVAIMTYDEHFGGSPEPGPVASLPFVRRSIENTLELIPREKVLMGLPFYNRIWRVAPNGSHTSTLHGMARPWVFLQEHSVTPVWDGEAGSYYANFLYGLYTYRIWIECERSIGEKLRIFRENNLAGVAGWRRGLETPEVWEVIG